MKRFMEIIRAALYNPAILTVLFASLIVGGFYYGTRDNKEEKLLTEIRDKLDQLMKNPQFCAMHGYYFDEDKEKSGFRMVRVDREGRIIIEGNIAVKGESDVEKNPGNSRASTQSDDGGTR